MNRLDTEAINRGLDWVEYSGRVMFLNTHDVEIGWKQFSGAIEREAEKRGMKVLIVSRQGNSWIHEGYIFVFSDMYSVR